MTKQNKLRLIYFLGFILALSSALPGYITSSFLAEFVSLRYVSLFFIVAMVLTMICINFFASFIKRFSNYHLALVVLVLNALSLFLLISATSVWALFLAFLLMVVTTSLIWINFDVFLERFSDNPTTGKIRTTYFTFINLAWLCSPVLAGYLVNDDNYNLAFLASAVLLLPVIFIILVYQRELSDHLSYEHHRTLVTLRRVWRNTNLRNIFFIAFLLQLFFSIAVLYIPFYLNTQLNFSWETIGWIFTIMLLPFVFLELPAGMLADKKWGEKRLLIAGFILIFGALLFMAFDGWSGAIYWAIVLFVSRCGAALVEAMRETYFFKMVDVTDLDYINFFRNTTPLAYIAGAALAFVALQFVDIPKLLLILAFIMLFGIYSATRLKDTK